MKKLFILMFVMILLVGTVSAFEFDNRLSYSENDMKINLTNWFGLGVDYGSAELKSHKSIGEVLKFGYGQEEVVMYYDFDFKELYSNGLGEVTFTNQKTGQEIQKNYSFVEWTIVDVEVNDYIKVCNLSDNETNVCNQEISGTHLEKRGKWIKYNSKDIPNTNIRIGLKTYIDKKDSIDGVWTIGGKKVERHAEWTAELEVDLISCWNFDEQDTTGSGTIFDEVGAHNGTNNGADNTTGKIGFAYQYVAANTDFIDMGPFVNLTGDATISFWIFDEAINTNQFHVSKTLNFDSSSSSGSEKIDFSAQASATANQDVFTHIVMRNNGTHNSIFLDNVGTNVLGGPGGLSPHNLIIGDRAEDFTKPFQGKIDLLKIWNRSLSISEISDDFNAGLGLNCTFPTSLEFPIITLDSPANNTNFTLTNNVVMNATIFAPTNITNVTLYLNDAVNETNSTSGLNNTLWTFTKNVGEGDTFWTMEACGFNNLCSNASQRVFNVNTTPFITYVSPTPTNEFNSTDNFFQVNVTITEDLFQNITFDLYNVGGDLNESVTFTNSSRQINWSSLPDAKYSYNVTIATTTNQFNSTETRNISINTTPNIQYISPTPINELNSTEANLTINISLTEDFFLNLTIDLYNVNAGLNLTVTFTNSSRQINWTDLADATYSYNATVFTTTGQSNSTETRNISIDLNDPLITVFTPTGDQGTFTTGLNLSLTWNTSNINIDVCQFDYEGSNTTVNCNNTEIGLIVTNSTATSLTFYVNDTFGRIGFNSTSWSYSFIENNITFTPDVFETDSQFFELNLSTSFNVSAISAQLNYNGTNFISSASCNSFCIVNNTIDIPLVTEGEFENKSFFWEINIFNGTDSINVNTSSTEQNVTRIHLEECGGAFTTEALNFTAFDEQNLSRIDPYLFDGTFEQWLGGGDVKRQSNFSQSSISEQNLCISPEDETFFIDSTIEYDEAGNASLYTLRNYYFQNDTINNVSQDIFMFLLQSQFSTSFILKVQDDALLPVRNVLIETNRFYPGLNEFRIVQIAKTDDLGKSVGFFETEIVDYKFIITFNNATLLETGIQKVIPETSPFTLTFNLGENLGEPWFSQIPLEDLISTLIWDDTPGIITYTYADSSTNLTLARLFVIQQSLVNSSADSTLCDVNSSLDAAILTCSVGNDSGFYTASAFISRNSIEVLDLQIGFQIETLSSVVGLLGLFYGWFLILIASFMFKFNEIAGIWAITIVVLLVNIMGLINFGGVFVTAIMGVAIFLTWLMSN